MWHDFGSILDRNIKKEKVMKKFFVFIFVFIAILSSCDSGYEKQTKKESVELLKILLNDPYSCKIDDFKLHHHSVYSWMCESKIETYDNENIHQYFLQEVESYYFDRQLYFGTEVAIKELENARDSVKNDITKNSFYEFYELTYHAKNGFGLMTIGKFYTIYRMERFADGKLDYKTRRMVAVAYDKLPEKRTQESLQTDYDYSEIELLESDDLLAELYTWDKLLHRIFEE